MGEVHIVDLDDALISWAMERLGSDYTVEKLDASKVSCWPVESEKVDAKHPTS